ncbi:putative coronin-2A-like [Triplophysa rosa]|uniref:Coronin n=1 Tax=Triplophysa rosa TaxID=992332 RepID=A0A9W7TB42_TRIRA|nr:putative coronin-2A-like [Triplophysa rosa]
MTYAFQTGRVSPLRARVCGHSARVLDVKWDPFNDRRIASCSEDCTVKVWEIPQNGLKDHMTQPCKDLLAHGCRVALIEWHPTARDLLLSSAYDCKVFVWCLDTDVSVIQTPVCVINTHQQLVLSLTFNRDGSLIATTCKDKKIRIIEPRTGRVLQESSSTSHRACKILFLWNVNMLLTTGKSCWNHRQFALWNLDLKEHNLQRNVHRRKTSHFHFWPEISRQSTERQMGVMPKRGLDVSACEVFRFYRLVAVRDLLEPLSFCVPRKQSGVFHEDIYSLTAANQPALTAHQWLMGQNQDPVLMSLRPGGKDLRPCHITSHDELLRCQDTRHLHDIIIDTREWTEDDTHSHDWISAHTLTDARWTKCSGCETEPHESSVHMTAQRTPEHLHARLRTRDNMLSHA